jgi:hypothetical protein
MTCVTGKTLARNAADTHNSEAHSRKYLSSAALEEALGGEGEVAVAAGADAAEAFGGGVDVVQVEK